LTLIKPLKSGSGFTIIELTIVIVILSILVSIIYFILKNLQSMSLETAAQKCAAEIIAAKNSAKTNNSVAIKFETDKKTYVIYRGNTADTLQLPNEIYCINSPLIINFNNRGISNNPSGDTIILTDGKKNAVINVYKITGEVVAKIK